MTGLDDDVTPGFRARDLRKSFGSHAVLNGLTLDVPQGCVLGLLGANGCGKTTLLKILLGLMPGDGGEAAVCGEPSAGLSPALRDRIGYVPQSTGQFSWLNGKAMLAYIGAFYPSFDRDYAYGLVERWSVPLKTPIMALSPGMQQRLSIVRALAPRPDLIVLDEPIASIDPATRIAVIDELLAEQSRRRLTVLFSSHITGDLRRFCSHFAVMARGEIALMEKTDALDRLVRLVVRGDDDVLNSLELEGQRHVRKSREGELVFVLEARDAERASRSLPSGCIATVEAADTEAVLSEWMQ